MTRFFLSTALAGLLFAAPAFAEAPKISTVEVHMDMAAITNPAAGLRYTHITDDLTNAITAMLADRIDKDGEKVKIHLNEAELSNSFTEATGKADTRLEGSVSIADNKDSVNLQTYVLKVDVNEAKTCFPADVDMATLKASSDVYYKALIQAFAKAVVDSIK
jgi:phenylpyruvate tautomerase PptA (4-oxalocrotonate tautomerase family)